MKKGFILLLLIFTLVLAGLASLDVGAGEYSSAVFAALVSIFSGVFCSAVYV